MVNIEEGGMVREVAISDERRKKFASETAAQSAS